MSNLVKGNVPVFDAAPGLAVTWGDWQAPSIHQSLVAISYTVSGLAPATLSAFVGLGYDDGSGSVTSRGLAPVVSSVVGDEVTMQDAEFICYTDANPHFIEAYVRAGYSWRVGFIRTVGDGTTHVDAVANVISDP